MVDAQYVAGRVRMARTHNQERDRNQMRIKAVRRGDYDTVAPGLFSKEFPKPLVANLIDTTARDIAEVMAPLPAFNCTSASLSNEADQERQDKRSAIANFYVQNSRLQEQQYGGADRYNSFGFKAYFVEPDYREQTPVIRVSTCSTAYYIKDYRGRTQQYCEVYKSSPSQLCADYGHLFEEGELEARLKDKFRERWYEPCCEVVRWHDRNDDAVILLDPEMVLHSLPNRMGKCMVRVVERPMLDDGTVTGQFDDVIWVQVARGLTQQYTFEALQRAVEAPLAAPRDVDAVDIGSHSLITSDNPGAIGIVNLNIPQGLFPESQILAQEQREGSRYPEGRSGSFDASIITGQGVQALMGTFDTQIQTYQRLDASALRDVIGLCFEMDEKFWPNTRKTINVEDNGSPRRVTYVPAKDINGNYLVNVSYGAIAGLDPNRGLVFVLQALAGGLISKSTARKSLPVDMNPLAEERQIDLEQMDQSISAAIAMLPQTLPQMAMGGMDPRELVLQFTKARELLGKGKSPAEAVMEVFAPKEQPQAAPTDPMAALMQGGAPGAPQTPGSSMLMTLAGMTGGGQAKLGADVSRMIPAAS